MKPWTRLFPALLLVAGPSFAQAPGREALVLRIERAEFDLRFRVGDVPLARLFMDPARRANLGAPEALWARIEGELSAALFAELSAPGSPLDKAVREATGSFAEDALAELAAFLERPRIHGFEAAMRRGHPTEASEAREEDLSALALGLTNEILRRHGLHEIR